MKNYKVTADPRVKLDLKEAKYFLESKQKGLSKKFLKDYRKALKKLQNNPFFQLRYKDIHCLPLEVFKYMLHFKIDEQNLTVTIYAVISTHRNPNTHWL
jgi:mRNA-degrading endonuclease RelE of RelBE toxin-antitoxin system